MENRTERATVKHLENKRLTATNSEKGLGCSLG